MEYDPPFICYKKENKVSKVLKAILVEALSNKYKLVLYDTVKCDVIGCYADSVGKVVIVITEQGIDKNTSYNLCSDHYETISSKLEGL